MKKSRFQEPVPLEELLGGLREQNEYQTKIVSIQEETISPQSKQNEGLAEMLDKVLRVTESGE